MGRQTKSDEAVDKGKEGGKMPTDEMAAKEKNTKNAREVGNGNSFTKEQLITSRHFRDRRDIVEALLKTGKLYTVKAVEEKIENYMKGKVK